MNHRLFVATVLLILSLLQMQSAVWGAPNIIDNNYEEGSGEELACHLAKRTINFHEDLGLSFILHPDTVDEGECIGYCPEISVSDSFTYYAIMKRISGGNFVETCCVPLEFSGVHVFSVTEKNEAYINHIENLKVTKCGCR